MGACPSRPQGGGVRGIGGLILVVFQNCFFHAGKLCLHPARLQPAPTSSCQACLGCGWNLNRRAVIRLGPCLPPGPSCPRPRSLPALDRPREHTFICRASRFTSSGDAEGGFRLLVGEALLRFEVLNALRVLSPEE